MVLGILLSTDLLSDPMSSSMGDSVGVVVDDSVD